MINSMQLALMKKDLRSIIANKRLFSVLLIVPLVFTTIMPTIFIFTILFSPDTMNEFQQILNMFPDTQQLDNASRTLMDFIFSNIMPMFFIIIPIMSASVMSASSFIGEKEKRTLETLLYCPLSLKKIFQAKVWASFILSMIVTFISFLAMVIVIESEVVLVTGSLLMPHISWLVTLMVVSPAVTLLAITMIVSGSAKAQTMEESQQRAAFLVLPLVLLVVGQFAGVVLIDAWILLGVGLVLAILAALFMKRAMRNFTYEMLLR